MKEITNQNGDIVIYQSEDGNTRINVNLQNETVWLSQQQLVELYRTSKLNISEHIKHIFEENELEESLVVRKFRTTDGISQISKQHFISCRRGIY